LRLHKIATGGEAVKLTFRATDTLDARTIKLRDFEMVTSDVVRIFSSICDKKKKKVDLQLFA
jgi:hypothetical protein